MKQYLTGAAVLAWACAAAPVLAQGMRPDTGKLLATGGVSQLEGAGGGGLTPWALITGYGTRDSFGGNLHATAVRTQDFALDTAGVAASVSDRVEVSLARQRFRSTGGALDGLVLEQDVVGVKLRVMGDAVYAQDSPLPQVAVGAMFKQHGGVRGLPGVTSVKQLGAKDERGIDVYLAATKVLLEHSLLLNGTVRFTKANQMGLLGFGGDRRDSYQPMFEGSAAYLVNRRVAAGAEYRMKPRNLALDNEKDYADVFLAWFPNKTVSLTAAYAWLGDITVLNPTRQKGWYLSLQAGF